MDLKQNPFSLYDFLGYFVPGALTLFAGFAISQAWLPADISQSISSMFQPSRLEFYLPFVLVSYITGHALSFVSSVTIEHYLVWRVGYPSRYLLGNPFPRFFDVTTPKDVTNPKCIRLIVRACVALLIFPISLLDFTIGAVLRLNQYFARPADNVLLNHINPRIAKLVLECTGTEPPSQDIASGDAHFFLLMYHYCVERAPAHLAKMQNYVALYGFCRTISFAFVLTFWSLISAMSLGVAKLTVLLPSVGVVAILAYLFYLDFMKFYRRFSLEVFMAFAVIYRPNPSAA